MGLSGPASQVYVQANKRVIMKLLQLQEQNCARQQASFSFLSVEENRHDFSVSEETSVLPIRKQLKQI